MEKARRFRPLSQVLKEKFGERVHKVSVDAGFSCPNKDGTISNKGCIFCDTLSFSPASSCATLPLADQLKAGMAALYRKYRVKKFLAYLQPNSNTYGPVELLEKIYRQLISQEGVVGLSIATRPDLVSEECLNLLENLAQETYLWVEYGLQSIHEVTLKLINRGHGLAAFSDAVARTKGRGIKICAHVILGLPGENREMTLATARFLSSLNIDGVKIHHLYVPRGTPLEKIYGRGELRPLELTEYVSLACDFLEYLSPQIVIHRLAAYAPPAFLVAPGWTVDRRAALAAIEAELERRDSHQGFRIDSR